MHRDASNPHANLYRLTATDSERCIVNERSLQRKDDLREGQLRAAEGYSIPASISEICETSSVQSLTTAEKMVSYAFMPFSEHLTVPDVGSAEQSFLLVRSVIAAF